MENKKSFPYYKLLQWIGLIGWFIETAYFGFNAKPVNGLEGALDVFFWVLIIAGFIGDIITSIHITKLYECEYKVEQGTFHLTDTKLSVDIEKLVSKNCYNKNAN